MFDIGWSELLVIGIVALVVIGPKELPRVLRTVGQTIGKLRRMAGEFQGQFQEALREAEFADLKKDLTGFADDAKGSISNSISGAMPSNPLLDIENELKAPTAPVQRADMPAADPVQAQLPEPSELEPFAFESVEEEVRIAAAKLDQPESLQASQPVTPDVAIPAPVIAPAPEPEVAEAVAALDGPPPPKPRAAKPRVAKVKPKADTAAEDSTTDDEGSRA